MSKVSVPNKSGSEPAIFSRSEHNISRQDIDEDALKIMYRLIRNGYKAFLVGGGVRDLLLKKKPKDFDIGTDATPRRIKSLFRNSRIIGRRFKLVHVYFRGNKIIEVSTFRDENEAIDEQEGRTDNVYGHEATDALRRDLTINGLFYDLANFSVIDYVGGMKDLHDGIIRVIGDPDARFRDDPVRLLRVIRHAARNGFKINEECWKSLVKNRELIIKSASVRVYEEIKKDFISGHFYEVLNLLAKSGLIEHVLPFLSGKAAEFLKPGHIFHEIIKKIDKLVQKNETITATAVLTVIAMALLSEDPEVTIDERKVWETVKEFISEIYSTFPVPRKEKERIVDIISAFKEISSQDAKKIRLNSLSKKPYFKDLMIAAKIAEGSLVTEGMMGILHAAVSNMHKEKAEHHTHRPNRHYNKMRRQR